MIQELLKLGVKAEADKLGKIIKKAFKLVSMNDRLLPKGISY